MINLILLFALLTGARADEAFDGVESIDWRYRVGREHVIPGYSPYLLELGIPIGTFEPLPPATPQAEHKNFQDLLGSSINERQAANAKMKESIAATQKTKIANAKAPETPGVAPDAPKELPVGAFDLPKFSACAIRTLPQLKMLLRAMIDGNRAGVLPLEEAVNAERGDGSFVRATGVACGTYLGKAGAPNATVSEIAKLFQDVKFLSAIALRSGAEQRQILVAYVATFHPKSPGYRTNVWDYYFKTLSFRSVFGQKPLATFAALATSLKSDAPILEFRSTAKETAVPVNVSISRPSFESENIDRLTREGLAYAEEILK